jgi:hypothetical protein
MIKEIPSKFTFNTAFYAMFLLLTIYHVVFREDFLDAASTLGIALIFDPFDQKMAWNQRPVWQRTWLILHLIILGALFAVGVLV